MDLTTVEPTTTTSSSSSSSSPPTTAPPLDERRRILIVTIGSRGDVQPYVALAKALVDQNFVVGMVTHQCHEDLFRQLGGRHRSEITFYGLLGDVSAILNSPEFIRAFYEGSMNEQMKVMMECMAKDTPKNFQITGQAAKDFQPDVILATMVCITECLALGQKYHVPVYILCTVPFYPSYHIPPVSLAGTALSVGFISPFLFWVGFKVLWSLQGKDFNGFRESIGLPPQTAFQCYMMPQIALYSEKVVPRPPDWPPHVHISGYLIESESGQTFQPPPDLTEFLSAGEPVYMGFGSMPIKDPRHILVSFSKALRALGMWGIFCSAYKGFHEQVESKKEETEDLGNVLIIKSAPHEWLFSRCSIIIHHGGAGTTAASLRSGKPTIIYPVLVDQPYWALRVAELGVGPPQWQHIKDISIKNIKENIALCRDNKEIRSKALKLGEQLRAEKNGTEVLIDIVKNYMNRHVIWPRENRPPPYHHVSGDGILKCPKCNMEFWLFKRKYNCASCGNVFCRDCMSPQRRPFNFETPQFVCKKCSDALFSSSSSTASSASLH